MLSETFENVQNGEIKSESGFRVAMASPPLEEIGIIDKECLKMHFSAPS